MWIHQSQLPRSRDHIASPACAVYGGLRHGETGFTKNSDHHWRVGCEECKKVWIASACPFCAMALTRVHFEDSYGDDEMHRSVSACPVCGWWKIVERNVTHGPIGPYFLERFSLAFSVLVALDVSDIDVPLQLCRDEVCARWAARFELHPLRLEEIVKSIFGDLGYSSELTAYSKDGGIDIYLRDGKARRIGVQVKRWKNTIGVAQIRELVGTLVVRGMASGVFVTTSEFSKDSRIETEQASHHGILVELVDGKRLFDYLKIAQIRRRNTSFKLEDLRIDPTNVTLAEIWREGLKG